MVAGFGPKRDEISADPEMPARDESVSCHELHRSPGLHEGRCGPCFVDYEPQEPDSFDEGKLECLVPAKRLHDALFKHQHQHKHACSDPRTKFLVAPRPPFNPVAVGSVLWFWRACMAQALDLDRYEFFDFVDAVFCYFLLSF